MDTVTQALLGATVGYLAAGKHAPRKALLWGAIIATLPDLDVFMPSDNDLDHFTLHRSWSHSWLMQSLITPFLAFLLCKIPNTFPYKNWLLLVWLAFITHSGLDTLTVYGTQLFWPMSLPPTFSGSVFIIDPIYSLPLLYGVIAILFRPYLTRSKRWLITSFLFSCCYLFWGLAAQNLIAYQAKIALLTQHIQAEKILVSATPFNTLLWRIVVINDTYYYEGFHSVFDKKDQFHFARYKHQKHLENLLPDKMYIERLDWFTHGFYALKAEQQFIMTDLRMGLEPHYFFSFALANEPNNELIIFDKPQHIRNRSRPTDLLTKLWQRIWDPSIQIKR